MINAEPANIDAKLGWPCLIITRDNWCQCCELIRKYITEWRDAPDFAILTRYDIDIEQLITEDSRVALAFFTDYGGMDGLRSVGLPECTWMMVEMFRVIESEIDTMKRYTDAS